MMMSAPSSTALRVSSAAVMTGVVCKMVRSMEGSSVLAMVPKQASRLPCPATGLNTCRQATASQQGRGYIRGCHAGGGPVPACTAPANGYKSDACVSGRRTR